MIYCGCIGFITPKFQAEYSTVNLGLRISFSVGNATVDPQKQIKVPVSNKARFLMRPIAQILAPGANEKLVEVSLKSATKLPFTDPIGIFCDKKPNR